MTYSNTLPKSKQVSILAPQKKTQVKKQLAALLKSPSLGVSDYIKIAQLEKTLERKNDE